MAKGIFSSMKGIDAFGKTTEDVKVKTRTGAFLTLLSAAIILAFSTIEFFDYRRLYMDTSILVDSSRGQHLTVAFNVSFPRVPCFLLSLDVMDATGEIQRDITHQIVKTRLDDAGVPVPNSHSAELRNEIDKLNEARRGNYCGSCYGGHPPESSGCCNTCESVREAYINRGWSFTKPDSIEQCVAEGWAESMKEQASEGCSIAGRVRVNKVAGNIQLSPGRSFQASSYQNVYELVPYLKEEGHRHDFSHVVHQLAFSGDDEYDPRKAGISNDLKKRLGIFANPLDNTDWKTAKSEYMFQYFFKVVSTQFRTLDGKTINTHQYSATQFGRDLAQGMQETDNKIGLHVAHGASGVPGVFFNYEISPILVVHTETRQSFAHFLTSTCAIVGGVLTVASILDQVLFATNKALKLSGTNVSGKIM